MSGRSGNGPGIGWYIVEFIRRLIAAVRHVRTGGQTTRRKADRKASGPPRRCSACKQPVPHSADWRDHIETDHPDWA